MVEHIVVGLKTLAIFGFERRNGLRLFLVDVLAFCDNKRSRLHHFGGVFYLRQTRV